jgi:spermidine synthase
MFFFFLGLISVLTQAVLLREIVNLSYGNEFFYVLGLGFWFLLVALGSFLGTKSGRYHFKYLWLLLLLCFGLFPFSLVLLRVAVSTIISSGRLLSFTQALLFLLFPLFLFCPLLGWLFVVAQKSKKIPFNLAYFAETIGFFIGGIIFSFWLTKTSFPLPAVANIPTLKRVYPGLVKVINSPYQQIVKTKRNEQISFYLSGQFAFDNQQKSESQLLAGLALSFISKQEKILVLGNPNLASALASDTQVKKVEFVEFDPYLLAEERLFLKDKITPVVSDLKLYLQKNPEGFDLIILSLPPPSSLLINRFYTQQFYQVAQKALKDEGILVSIFYFPTNYQSRELLRLGRTLYQTFASVFNHHLFLSLEDQVVLIGGRKAIVARQEKLAFLEKIYPFFSQDFLDYQIKKPARQLILEKLLSTKEKINTDFSPIAFFYQILFWQTLFNFQIPKLIFAFIPWLLLFFGILVLVLTLSASGDRQKLWAITFSSFLLMSLQILLIFSFQGKFGYLYSQIAFLFALVVLGMALGVILVEKRKFSFRLAIPCFFNYILVAVILLLEISGISSLGFCFWWALALFLGFNAGVILAVMAKELSSKGDAVSLVYVFDLLGAVLGVVLAGAFFFPIWGLVKFSFFLAILICLTCYRLARA